LRAKPMFSCGTIHQSLTKYGGRNSLTFIDVNRVNYYINFRCTWYLANIPFYLWNDFFVFLMYMWIFDVADIYLYSFILLVLVSGMSMPPTSWRHWDSRLQNTRKLFEED
jgi:hypothetical protein